MFETQKYTRQALLRHSGALAGAFAFGGVITACGGSDGGGDVGATTAETGAAASAAGDAEARLTQASGTVRTLMWEGYEHPPAYESISDRVKVNAAFMAANEDVINKKQSYDVGCGINGIYPALQAAGVLSPLDLAMIPNIENVMDSNVLFTEFKTPQFTVFDGKPAGMPYVWASQGISFVADKVPKAPESLEDFLDPAYRGKLGIGDDGNSVIIQVARLLGFGGERPAFLTEDEFDQVFAKLEEFKAQAKGIIANPYGEYAGAYARGEIIAAFPDWAPTTAAAQDGGVDAQMAFTPQSFSWIDTLFINANVEATDAIYAFLNQGLATETQFAVGNELLLAVVNEEAQQRLVGQRGAWAYYGDIDALTANAPVVEWPPVESDEYVNYSEWLRRWQEFKAS
jgi:spermidine/putrescine-binding protein